MDAFFITTIIRETMYTVEQAKINDIPELLEIALQFWNESPNYKQRPININKVKTQLQTLVLYPSQGCVLIVKDDEDKILGGFMGRTTRRMASK